MLPVEGVAGRVTATATEAAAVTVAVSVGADVPPIATAAVTDTVGDGVAATVEPRATAGEAETEAVRAGAVVSPRARAAAGLIVTGPPGATTFLITRDAGSGALLCGTYGSMTQFWFVPPGVMTVKIGGGLAATMNVCGSGSFGSRRSNATLCLTTCPQLLKPGRATVRRGCPVKWIPGVGVVASAIAGDGLAVTTGDGTSAPTTLDTCWRVSSGGGCGTCRTAALMLPLPCKATTNLTTVGPESATGLGAEPSASAALGAVTAARDGVSVLPDADATPTWTVAVRAGVGVLPTANAAAGVAI